jgi:hypothetical protein
MIPGFKAIAGVAILFFGRKLYWFTVAAVGFFIALELTIRLFEDQSTWLAILLALIVGVIGAVLAITIQRLTIGLLGFVLGGYVLLQASKLIALQLNGWNWLVFILGGVLGVVLLSALFEWTLIGLSAVIGSVLITQSTLIPYDSRWWVFILALLLGLCVQIYIRMTEKRDDAP